MEVLEGSAAKYCRTLSAFSDYLRPPGPFSFHVWEAEVVISAPAAEKLLAWRDGPGTRDLCRRSPNSLLRPHIGDGLEGDPPVPRALRGSGSKSEPVGPKPVLPLLGRRVCSAQRRLLGTFPADFR
jgi:hypothetical protein